MAVALKVQLPTVAAVAVNAAAYPLGTAGIGPVTWQFEVSVTFAPPGPLVSPTVTGNALFTAALVGADMDIEQACAVMLFFGFVPICVKGAGVTDATDQDAGPDPVQLGSVDTVTLICVEAPPPRFGTLMMPLAGLTSVTPDGGVSVIAVIAGPVAGALFVSVMFTVADADPAATVVSPVRLKVQTPPATVVVSCEPATGPANGPPL